MSAPILNNPYLYLACTILLWGSSVSIIKLLLSSVNKDTLLFYSIVFSIIGLFVVVLLQRKLYLIRMLKLKDLLIMASLGFIGVFLYYKFLYLALLNTSTQIAFIINYTWALWIVVFSFFLLKEDFKIKKIIGMILGIFGVSIVVLVDNSLLHLNSNYKGILFAFIGAITYGLFSTISKKLNYDKTISVLFFYIFSLLFVAIDIHIIKEETVSFDLSVKELLGLIYIGVFCSGIAFVFWLKALDLGETSKMSNLILLVPFVSLVYISILLKEPILKSSILGLIFIVSGVMIQNIKTKAFK